MGLYILDPFGLVSLIYQCVQVLIFYCFAPRLPSQRPRQKPLGHVAVIGAGITGVSTASHLIGHGFEVTLFEASSEIGGIWSRVNSTSGLQINSIMYRFHPAVKWGKGYPRRDEILHNTEKIWEMYDLKQRTRFNCKITSVKRHSSSTDPAEGGHARWILNDKEDEVFDGLVVCVGTCGKPKKLSLPGEEKFKGEIVHSSELDDLDLKGKKVLIVGGGASGIEALELAVEKKADKPTILARSDKWIIPRLTLVDVLLGLQPFGRETFLSWIPELLIRKLHYRDLDEKMSPTDGLYTGTPIVNTSALYDIRKGRADYQRGDVIDVTETGIKFNARKRGQKKGSEGEEVHYEADIIVVATGFEKPSIDFLPQDLFPEDYVRPNMYLQVFPVVDSSVLCTNSTIKDGIGSFGHVHIGIMARSLMVFLMDEDARPRPKHMRLWVDLIRFIKEKSPAGALDFITYTELCIFLVSYLFFRASRIKYFFFVTFGLGFWSREGQYDKRGRAVGEPKFRFSLSKLVPGRKVLEEATEEQRQKQSSNGRVEEKDK
ncbi:FAD/NAD(P)-binding domain-containing protein [Violaceomyces palustris]|uniref:FAD/NAD(P)-binding domain-containing protein n=1 Tax=Violaceomyces palustris TaxID=1673888 RepID=A0ACD0NYT8_9BASI|nr:FAD/NAD(P)-binding domain-containing protein [Violaceomyces palustris]